MAILNVTKANFESEVAKSEKTVLLDFWATWCGPCRMIAPIVDAVAQENPDVLVGKVNVDEEMELARSFNVMSIPTLVVLKGGKVVNQSIGVQSKEQILKLVKG
ncbi:MAG: thioredoxin [Lachnospiraceae bacterium]|nr:thioredoxin [Lachnospiraceae bacterium]